MSTLIFKTIDIDPLLKAQGFLNHAIQKAQSDLEKAGAIQAFEFCFELSWRTMKRILAFKGIDVASPRSTFRAAAKDQLIQDPEQWFAFIEKRNLTVHTYNLNTAEEVFQFLPTFADELTRFIDTIKTVGNG